MVNNVMSLLIRVVSNYFLIIRLGWFEKGSLLSNGAVDILLASVNVETVNYSNIPSSD